MRFQVGDREIAVDIHTLVIGGWSGRDPAAIAHHIEELKAIGVAPPSKVPLFYRVSAPLLTQADSIQCIGDGCSGEVEAVLIGSPEGTLVACGSDHTDRKAEAFSVPLSKQLCPKPVSRWAWRLEEVLPAWDELLLEADRVIADGDIQAYQRGTLGMCRRPEEMISGAFDGAERMPEGAALFLGTIPASGGIEGAPEFRARLRDPRSGNTLSLRYAEERLPLVT